MASYIVASPTHPGAPKLTCDRVGGVVGENSFKFFVQFMARDFSHSLRRMSCLFPESMAVESRLWI
jgi:hypothetical protein